MSVILNRVMLVGTESPRAMEWKMWKSIDNKRQAGIRYSSIRFHQTQEEIYEQDNKPERARLIVLF